MRYASDELSTAGTGTLADATAGHLLASLALGFSRDANTTRLTRKEHRGPLRVQKALYPEGPDCCHGVIIHPPGGVVGGDELRISMDVGDAAHALISTPGAAKWYRANGHISRQRLDITVGRRAMLEWLPQETILFNEADVVFDSHITLQKDARYLGCEILCFGRTASGERFAQGRVRQSVKIFSERTPIFIEQGELLGNGGLMGSVLGMAGHTVCANLLCAGAPLANPLLESVRKACAPLVGETAKFGATQLKTLVLARYLGDSSEVARQVMLAAWRVLRPALLGREPTELRIWNT